MKIYVQGLDGFPAQDWCVSAYMGFRAKGGKLILYEDIEEVPISRDNLLVGPIDDTIAYFKRLGFTNIPTAMNVPIELKQYAGRELNYMTMGEFRKQTKFPIFLKPNAIAKEFVAGVMFRAEDVTTIHREVPDDMPVMTSEVVDFVSEYRCYVINGKLVGILFYLGDLRVFPDVKVIDAIIADFKTAPAGYGLDVGITSDGRTLLVECTDGWSIGNYGLEDKLYTKLLSARWVELLNTNNPTIK